MGNRESIHGLSFGLAANVKHTLQVYIPSTVPYHYVWVYSSLGSRVGSYWPQGTGYRALIAVSKRASPSYTLVQQQQGGITCGVEPDRASGSIRTAARTRRCAGQAQSTAWPQLMSRMQETDTENRDPAPPYTHAWSQGKCPWVCTRYNVYCSMIPLL